MSIKAIVYTSNTGYTAEYAVMLSEKTGIPAYSLENAHENIEHGSDIIYLSWLMAGGVTEYKKASRLYNIKAVCAVGLCETGSITDDVRRANKIPDSIAVFTLQGGYAPEKLRGMNKLLMKLVTRMLVKKIDSNKDKTESDYRMRKILTLGGSCVTVKNLDEVTTYLHNLAC